MIDQLATSPSPAPPGDALERASQPNRIAFVDALRGIAASLVVLSHVLAGLWSGFRYAFVHVVDVGQLGVVIFFLCSGFVIPATLEREGSLRIFWVRRFFRLYPLFWFSLAAALLLSVANIDENGHLTRHDWLANISMVPSAFGAIGALPVYWTLAYEMLFYLVVSALFAARLNHLYVELSLMMSGAAVVFAIVVPTHVAHQVDGAVFWLGTMLTGCVLYRAFSRRTSVRAAVASVAATLASGLTLLVTSLYGVPRPDDPTASHFWPLVVAWGGAYAVFLLLFAGRRGHARWMVGLGTISYSIYLMHPIVLVAVPLPVNPVLFLILGLGSTVAVSAVTYVLIERPAIRLGRRFSLRA